MCPKIVDKEVKKQDILEASIRVFARQGIAHTKMIDIANEAGIGKGTIYEYFRSKEEIIKETFRNFMSKMDAAGADQLEQISDPVDKLCHIVDGWMSIFEGSYEESKMIIEFWAQSIRLENALEEFDGKEMINNFKIFLAGIIEEGMSEGTVHQVDADLMAAVIIGSLDGIALHWIIGRDSLDLKKAVELFKETTIEPLRKK